ncbi:STAS domain-containing protein [Fulvimonas yonginensis]|uniref:STAS domain-containing protein n=1 Tax=Fulvimonas yonginensis TaxID=1495200 RepID=A0ABU8J8T3_9GAMM
MGSKRGRGEPTVLEIGLPADCRMAAQTALLADLLGALDAPAARIDGRAVERVDTAALQLLTLFRREALARGCAVSWQGASTTLREAADTLGLAQALDLPALMPA